MPNSTKLPPAEALALLKAGNARFASNSRKVDPHAYDYAVDEKPIAIILGCCDHRVPPDILFDQGLGNLFTIRVAGNIVTPTQLGSIEFGALTFGPRLIVVMGHQRCGAIMATLKDQIDKQPPGSDSLKAIVDEIAPTCCSCIESHGENDEFEKLTYDVTMSNINHSIERLRTDSPILKDLAENDGLQIIGAYYNMDEGRVQFLED
jgi:carbonic anhydrase